MQRSYYVFLEEVLRGLCPYLKRELVICRVPMMIKVTFSTLKGRDVEHTTMKFACLRTLQRCVGGEGIFFCSFHVCDYNKYGFGLRLRQVWSKIAYRLMWS